MEENLEDTIFVATSAITCISLIIISISSISVSCRVSSQK